MYENEKRLINLSSGILIVKKAHSDYLNSIEEITKQGFKIKLESDKRYYYKTWISAIFNLYHSFAEELKNENFNNLFDKTEILELKKEVSKKYEIEKRKVSLLDLMRNSRHKHSHPRRDESLDTILIEFVKYDDILVLQKRIILLINVAMEKVDKDVLITFQMKNEIIKLQSAKFIDTMKKLKGNPKIKENSKANLIVDNMTFIYEKMFLSTDVLDEGLIVEIECKFEETLQIYKDKDIKELINEELDGAEVLFLTEEFLNTTNEFSESYIEQYYEKIRQLFVPAE